jgi:hypothetical protein
MDIKRVGEAECWINGQGRGHSTEHAGQHARPLGGWYRPQVVLGHHRFGETNEATILAIVNVDVPDLAGPYHAGNQVAVIVLNVDEDWRGGGVEIPHVMRDVLEVAGIFACIEIKRYERLGVEIVTGSDRAVEARRRIADHEVDALRREIDGWVLPDGAA